MTGQQALVTNQFVKSLFWSYGGERYRFDNEPPESILRIIRAAISLIYDSNLQSCISKSKLFLANFKEELKSAKLPGLESFIQRAEKWNQEIEARFYLSEQRTASEENQRTAELCRLLYKEAGENYRDPKLQRIIISCLKCFFLPLYEQFRNLADIIRNINNSIFGMDKCDNAICTMENFVQRVPADEFIMSYPKASSNEVVQAREFLNRERSFQRDLYAILGYFAVELKSYPRLLDELNKAFNAVDILGPHGYLQQMLATSRRFTDQLDDMFDGDEELEKEDQSGSIAEIFHDVAKGQVLDTFIEYAKLIVRDTFGNQHHSHSRTVAEVYDSIKKKIEAKVNECTFDIVKNMDAEAKNEFMEIRGQVIWLLPELLLRPIYRAFCTIENLNAIKDAIRDEIVESYDDLLRVNYLQKEERILDQVIEEGNKLKSGLTTILSKDWLTSYKRHFNNFFPSLWYRESDEKRFLSDSDKELKTLIEEKTSPEKVSYWGGKSTGHFWDDAEEVILDEPIKEILNGKKHLFDIKNLKQQIKKDKRRVALVKRTFSVGFLIYSKTKGALFKIDEWQGDRNYSEQHSDTTLERLIEDEKFCSNKIKVTIVFKNKVSSQASESRSLVFNATELERKRLMVGLFRARKHRAINKKISALLKTQIETKAPQPHRNEFLEAAPDSPFGEEYVPKDRNTNLISLLEIIETRLTANQVLPKHPKSQNPHESAEDHFTRIFLFVYKKLKDEKNEDLSPDKLFQLLKLRFSLPKEIEENEEFKIKLGKGEVCFGEFHRSYENKYFNPVQVRVIRVVTQWVREDPWGDMHCPLGGGKVLAERILDWMTPLMKTSTVKVRSAFRTLKKTIDQSFDCHANPNLYGHTQTLFRGNSLSPEGTRRGFAQVDSNLQETMWHSTRDPKEFSLLTLHPIELAKQITLYTLDILQSTRLDDLWKGNKSELLKKMVIINDTWVVYLQAAIILERSPKRRREIHERLMEMVVQFRLQNNFMWEDLIIKYVIDSSAVKDVTRREINNSPFSNQKLKDIYEDHQKRTNRSKEAKKEEAIFWMCHPPNLPSYQDFNGGYTRTFDVIKDGRKPGLNDWTNYCFLGFHIVNFLGACKADPHRRPSSIVFPAITRVDSIQEWLSNWDPRQLVHDEQDWEAKVGRPFHRCPVSERSDQDKEDFNNYLKKVSEEKREMESQRSPSSSWEREDFPRPRNLSYNYQLELDHRVNVKNEMKNWWQVEKPKEPKKVRKISEFVREEDKKPPPRPTSQKPVIDRRFWTTPELPSFRSDNDYLPLVPPRTSNGPTPDTAMTTVGPTPNSDNVPSSARNRFEF